LKKNKIKKCSKCRWLAKPIADLKTKRLRHNEKQIPFSPSLLERAGVRLEFAFQPSALIPFPFGF
jgi:hypothetical protein